MVRPQLFGIALLVSAPIAFFSGITQFNPENLMYRTLLNGNLFYMYSAETWPFYDPIKHEMRFQPFVGLAQNTLLLFPGNPSENGVFVVQATLAVAIILIVGWVFHRFYRLDRTSLFLLAVFGVSPSFVFSTHHPMLAETIAMIALPLIFLSSAAWLERCRSAGLLWVIIAIIFFCFAKISAAVIALLYFGSIFLVGLVSDRETRRPRLTIGIIGIVVTLFCSSVLIAYTGKPPDSISNITMFIKLYAKTEPILFLAIPLTAVWMFSVIRRRLMLRDNEMVALSAAIAGSGYFLALILFGKYSEYQQVLCYEALLFGAYLLFMRMQGCSTSAREVRYVKGAAIAGLMMLWLVYYRDVAVFLAWVTIIVLAGWVLRRKFKGFRGYFPGNVAAASVLAYTVVYLVIPGAALHLWHGINVEQIRSAAGILASGRSDGEKGPVILNATVHHSCDASIMHDFFLNERLEHYGSRSHMFVPNPSYMADTCRSAVERFEETYAKLPITMKAGYVMSHEKNPQFVVLQYPEADSALSSLIRDQAHLPPEQYREHPLHRRSVVWSAFYPIARAVSVFRYASPSVIVAQRI